MWNEHFTEMEDVVLDEQHTFRVYFANRDKENKLPLLLLLHGGGYSALTWAHFCVIFNYIYLVKIVVLSYKLIFIMSFRCAC